MTLISFFKKRIKILKINSYKGKYYFKKWRVILNILDFSKLFRKARIKKGATDNPPFTHTTISYPELDIPSGAILF